MYFCHPSLCLLAPSFVPALFLRSPITLYLSFLLSFTRVSLQSFCRSHVLITRTFWVNRFPGIGESPLSSSFSRARLLPPSSSSTSFRPFFTLPSRSLHRSSVIRPAIDHSRSWCSGGAADPVGVDYRDAALSSSIYYHPPPPLGILLSSLRLSLSSLGPSVWFFFHPSAFRSLSPFVFRARAH